MPHQTPTQSPVRGPLVGLVALVAGLAVSSWVSWQHAGQVTDFTQDYFAARAVLSGRNVYDPVGENELAQHGMSLAGNLDATVQNYHPPFDSVLVVPLAWLPYRTASLAWSALTVSLYLTLLVLLGRSLRLTVPAPVVPLAGGLALFWPPYMQHLQDGQFSLLIAVCLWAAWWLARAGRDTPAGLLIGCAAAVKLFPLLFLVHFFLRRRWRVCAAGLFTFVLCGIASGFAAGWDVLHQYVSVVAPRNSAEYADNPYNLSLPGLLHRLFSGSRGESPAFPGFVPVVDLGAAVGWLKLGVAVAVYGPVAWRLWKSPRTQASDDMLFAQTAVAMLLLSPLTWQHALVIALLPLAVLWHHGDRAGVVVTGVLFSFPVVVVARSVVQHFYPDRAPAVWSLVPAVPTLGLIFLMWRLGRPVGRLSDATPLAESRD